MGVTESQMAISCHQMSSLVPGLGGQGDLMKITKQLSMLLRQWIASPIAKNTHINSWAFHPLCNGKDFCLCEAPSGRLALVTEI